MKKIAFLLFLLVIAITNLCSQIKIDTLKLDVENGFIEGTLMVADQSNPTPVVIIIAGSGPTDRNGNNPAMVNNSLKMLAVGLMENGISSLRYDKRGIGNSKVEGLNELDLRFEDYVGDVRGWIELLDADDRFSEVIVAGHSEGALIGMIATQDSKATKFISMAGGGSSAPDILREQFKAQPEEFQKQAHPILDSLEQGMLVKKVPFYMASLFRPSVQPYLISWFKYDPTKEVEKLNIPILILQGTTDIQVAVSEAEKLHQASNRTQLHIIEGMNHILKNAELERSKNIATYNDPDLPVNKAFLHHMVDFIKAK